LVAILDKIRFEIDKKDEEGKLFEFYWFAREYPRFYRYHLDHAEYRLNQIHEKYQNLSKEIVKIHYQNSDSDIFQVSVGGLEAHVIYWDFESYLSSISCALDVLARVVGTAYSGSPPVSFNKLCAKKEFTGIVDILRKAQSRWVHRLKDYRDCFIHYTPVDNMVSLSVRKEGSAYRVRCKLPVNPNIRENIGFRYSKRVELLSYAATVFRNMQALDRSVARELKKLYVAGAYPARTSHLFFVGQRSRK